MGMSGFDGRKPMDFSQGGRTRQSEKDACDVNLIVAHHQRGGISTHVMNRVAEYGFVPAVTFQDALNEVRKANEAFAVLPAETRARFANDPGRFVAFCGDPANLQELLKLGLAVEKAKPAPLLGSAENPIFTRAEPAGSAPE